MGIPIRVQLVDQSDEDARRVEEALRAAGLDPEVTRVKDAERDPTQLVLTDRLASIGTIAAGIAHEINNPLAALIANLELLQQDLELLASIGRSADPGEAAVADRRRGARFLEMSAEMSEVVRDSREAADRMRAIVRDLKVFTHPAEEDRGPADVERVLESATRIAWSEIRHRARLVREYGRVPPVAASAARLGQVFINLLVNAAQACEEGRAEGNEIRLRTALGPSGFVSVEVEDTGAGIPPERMPRLFEAFFTTKGPGTGTGLGLTISHRLVTSAGGRILVESTPGRGTTFRVHLPIASGPAAPSATPPSLPVAGAKRRKILIVDDEEAVAASLRRILAIRHEVSAVTSAAEAFDLIQAGGDFDVILCDLLMPSMTGMDFHAQLLPVRPDLAARIVFMSGGAFTPRAVEFLEAVPNQRIDKPVDIRALLALIEQA